MKANNWWCLFAWSRILLCRPGWPQTCNPLASTSWVLGWLFLPFEVTSTVYIFLAHKMNSLPLEWPTRSDMLGSSFTFLFTDILAFLLPCYCTTHHQENFLSIPKINQTHSHLSIVFACLFFSTLLYQIFTFLNDSVI
jgi:hypothetical protein